MEDKHRIVFYLLAIFLVLRIMLVTAAGQKEYEFHDANSYNGYAKAIVQNNDWLTNPDFTGHYRPPGYPVLIALVYAIFGLENFLAVYILQAIVSTLTCFYIYKFSKKIFNDKAALLSLIWAGFYIYYFKYARELLRETLVFFLIFVFFYYLYLYITEEIGKKKNFWLVTILYFLLIHTAPRYLFYLPFLILLFVIYQPFRQGVKKYFIFAGFTILLMIPWTIRNYVAYDAFVLINTRTLDLRKSEFRDPELGLQFKYHILNFGIINHTIMNKNYPTEEERELIKKGFNPDNRSEYEVTAIKNDIYPASTFIGRKWYQFSQLWKPFDFLLSYRPFPDSRFNEKWSLIHNVTSILCYGLLLPFLFFGIFKLIQQKNRIWIFLTFPLIIQTLLHVIQWGQNRYRMPIDSFIIIIATYGIYLIVKKLPDSYKKLPILRHFFRWNEVHIGKRLTD